MTTFDPTNPTPEQVADYEAYLERHGLLNDPAARRAAAAQQRHNRGQELKGLRLTVYRAAGRPDTTNGGLTAVADRVTVVGIRYRGTYDGVVPMPLKARNFAADADAPAVVLVESRTPGYGPHLEPLEGADAIGPMFGGNLAGSTDSRWAELGDHFLHGLRLDAVQVHDRFETAAQYRALSAD